MLGITARSRASQTNTNAPVQLTPEMFRGYEFTLISDKDYIDYTFVYDFGVRATYGQKKGGGMVGFSFDWKIKDGNTLVFFTPMPYGTNDGPEKTSLQFKSSGDDIFVTMYGQKFKRTKFKIPD